MKKALEMIGAIALGLMIVVAVYAASVTAPTVTLSKVSPSGGMEMRDIIITDLETIATAVGTAAIDGGAGSFTTLAASGAATMGSTLAVTGNTTVSNVTASGDVTVSETTASQAVFTDGNKKLVSNAITGTGNVVMSATPTLTGTVGAENITASGTLAVTGVATLTLAPKLTVTETAEAQTLTMTNAPAGATAAKDTPIYIKITVGETDYVVPAWALAAE